MPRWGWRNFDPEGSFWSKVDKSSGPNACWPWTAAEDTAGYGAVKWGGKKRGAHTVALELKLGRPITPGLIACHSQECTTRLCCNPVHLYEGTYKQNAADTAALGRQVIPRGMNRVLGEDRPSAALTDEHAIELCKRAMAGESPRALGRIYGVSHVTVIDIREGRKRPYIREWILNGEV